MTVYEYGVDLHSSLSFNDGDLTLSKYNENLGQAICNRLNTIQDSLNLFYNDYGSVLLYFCGWRSDEITLNFMKIEIENVLKSDPRINDFNVDLEYISSDSVKINIRLNDFNEEVNLNLVLDSNGIVQVVD